MPSIIKSIYNREGGSILLHYGSVLQYFTGFMTFVMMFTYKVVSQIVLQHHLAAAATWIRALVYMRFGYMPTN